MQQIPGFVSARPEQVYPLHTTHSPDFLGLIQNLGFWNSSRYGTGIIIGLLDSGISPYHPSFSNQGMLPLPGKWKGTFEFTSRACNNKLIGARYFGIENGSPSDEVGHGTHTTAAAAGNFIEVLICLATPINGTAVGMAPLAHLAMYKVCGLRNCLESDIIAGMDAAINDGVDVLSISLGGQSSPFYNDTIEVGAYRAMVKGISVSCSAGNCGPSDHALSNEAPWILTVERLLCLGTTKNQMVNQLFGLRIFLPQSANAFTEDVRGKIVRCELGGLASRVERGEAVKNAGGAAMIIMNQNDLVYTILAEAHVPPTIHISHADGLKVKAYLNSTSKPTTTIIFKGTIIGNDRAPVVAGFSSNGPSQASPGILKPDIIGPSVNILAAWPDKRLLPANVFATGSGHVNPSRANDPGLVYDNEPNEYISYLCGLNYTNQQVGIIVQHQWLVYDIDQQDYLPYLCGLNYTNRQVGIIVNRPVRCSEISSIPEAELNYPSFSVFLGNKPQTYNRTVKNVGEANPVYSVGITKLPGVEIRVEPTTLQFSQLNQKLTYQVTFNRLAKASSETIVHGSLMWTSTKYSVRSPIVVFIV
ncbi:Tripeptidyl-peptidase II [Handroanthus impetiginosus]|uniref:Tripeptidyl-peptidase II n=1 Tax=Handroanthus impetiginosus TaxID=429701 RepID=A0A2G9H9N5_9LAMI|nr:Tripeptidyl-peptidase II [Handroanthus impetiginosus]